MVALKQLAQPPASGASHSAADVAQPLPGPAGSTAPTASSCTCRANIRADEFELCQRCKPRRWKILVPFRWNSTARAIDTMTWKSTTSSNSTSSSSCTPDLCNEIGHDGTSAIHDAASSVGYNTSNDIRSQNRTPCRLADFSSAAWWRAFNCTTQRHPDAPGVHADGEMSSEVNTENATRTRRENCPWGEHTSRVR